MPKLEKVDEGRFVRLIERLGGEAIKQDATSNAFIPDRLCWLPVKTEAGIAWFWAEWKQRGKKPTKGQLARHARLRDAGHTVFVFDNYEDAYTAVMSYRPLYA